MVLDILEELKSKLLKYQKVISETENKKIRQNIQKTRNEYEAFQYELIKIAKQKGYYPDIKGVDKKQINEIKKEL